MRDQEDEDEEEESEYFDKKKWQRRKIEVRDFAMQCFGFQPLLTECLHARGTASTLERTDPVHI